MSNQWTISGSNIYYNSGNVGIGTESPTQKLEVNGSTLIPSGQSYWIGNAEDTGNRLRLHQSGANAYIDWGEEMLFLRSGATSVSTRVVIDGNGRVGIGTDQPKAALDLSNSLSNRKIALNTSADNDHQFAGFGYNGDALVYQLSGTTGNHKFYAATSATNSTELFRIQGNGQIVIPALTTAGVLVNSTAGLVSSSIGTSGQVLTTNGSGGITWTTPTTGTVTSVTGTTPISVATGTTTPVISIATATTSTAGSMSAADKTKLDGIPTLSIGQSYQGGIIFWLDATGQHGLIAATADQSSGIQWYNGTNRYTGTTGDGLYAGAMNTAMIIATQMADNQTGNFAAKVCADYSVTVSGVTYGDWYLPSKYELNLLFQQKTAVGGFTGVYYWSSTESSNGLAWGHDFDSGGPGTNQKNVTDKVRAVRAF